MDQKTRFFKPSIAQLEERGTVTDAFYPEVAGSSPARRTLFSLPEVLVVVVIVIAVTDY